LLRPYLAAFLLSAAPATCLAIKNGEPTQAYAAVGLLLKAEAEGFVPACSGVLISPQAFLTAAHCLDGSDAGQYAIFRDARMHG
jgi:V8-like Glu-specific endopeptidase